LIQKINIYDRYAYLISYSIYTNVSSIHAYEKKKARNYIKWHKSDKIMYIYICICNTYSKFVSRYCASTLNDVKRENVRKYSLLRHRINYSYFTFGRIYLYSEICR